MSAPVPELFGLMAGRPLEAGPGIVASAIEHRLGGLLYSAVESGDVELADEDRRTLTAAEIANTGHNRHLWKALLGVLEMFDEIGVEAMAIKGVAEERRLYDRLGDRPSSDLDLVIAPHDLSRIDEVVARVGLDYAPVDDVVALVGRRQLQHIHTTWDGVALDLHLDPLKLGIWTRQGDLIIETATTVMSPDGGTAVPVLAPELALVAFLTHLNKDRFSLLGAFGDVARLATRPDLDWDLVERFVAGEALEVPVWKSLGVVVEALDLDVDVPTVKGWRARLWDRLWPPSARLLGREGKYAGRHRQEAIPLLTTGRWPEVLREARRAIMPPRTLLDFHRPDLRGHGRLRRITVDRF